MEIANLLADPEWLPHRYDETGDAFRFVRVPREGHRAVTFLTDEYLSGVDDFVAVPRVAIDPGAIAKAPLQFVFHSAYCCSTLVARMFDAPGLSMGLKEPQLLNDMIGWRRRGAEPKRLASTLDASLALISRPFAAGEMVVAKPSNIVNSLSPAILALRPEARAIQLYAPIEEFLASVADKGMWGRRWVRQALVGQVHDDILCHRFTAEELLELTDLQAAGLGWLSNHAVFHRNRQRFGADRVMLCDSETVLADPQETAVRFFEHFGIMLDDQQAQTIAAGEAFTTNSKDGSQYSRAAREARLATRREKYGEEIDMVATWVRHMAQGLDIPIDPA